MPEVAYLYVIAASPDGPVKLGYSDRPERRMRALQTGRPDRLSLYHQEPVSATQARRYEQRLHRDLNHIRTGGEWFAMTTEQAIAEVRFTLIEYGLELEPAGPVSG